MNDLMMALIKSLIANGVKVPAEEPVCLGGEKIACGNELDTFFNLDFSEHDKMVAEEKDKKIAELEKENSALKEKFSLIRTRVTAEAREFWDKDMFGSLMVTVPKKLNAENKINLNDRIKFKLTPLGAEIYYHQYDEINKKAGRTVIEPHMPKIDKDGYTEYTLWAFMELYGNHIGVGKRNVIDSIDIFVL